MRVLDDGAAHASVAARSTTTDSAILAFIARRQKFDPTAESLRHVMRDHEHRRRVSSYRLTTGCACHGASSAQMVQIEQQQFWLGRKALAILITRCRMPPDNSDR
jgi:hypothetical protein